MSETKHTPGPWARMEYPQNDMVLGADGLLVANCGNDLLVNQVCPNARLIAAAPELLHEHKQWASVFGSALADALQGNYRRIDDLAHGVGIRMVNGEPTMASAAITKAEEGTS